MLCRVRLCVCVCLNNLTSCWRKLFNKWNEILFLIIVYAFLISNRAFSFQDETQQRDNISLPSHHHAPSIRQPTLSLRNILEQKWWNRETQQDIHSICYNLKMNKMSLMMIMMMLMRRKRRLEDDDEENEELCFFWWLSRQCRSFDVRWGHNYVTGYSLENRRKKRN